MWDVEWRGQRDVTFTCWTSRLFALATQHPTPLYVYPVGTRVHVRRRRCTTTLRWLHSSNENGLLIAPARARALALRFHPGPKPSDLIIGTVKSSFYIHMDTVRQLLVFPLSSWSSFSTILIRQTFSGSLNHELKAPRKTDPDQEARALVEKIIKSRVPLHFFLSIKVTFFITSVSQTETHSQVPHVSNFVKKNSRAKKRANTWHESIHTNQQTPDEKSINQSTNTRWKINQSINKHQMKNQSINQSTNTRWKINQSINRSTNTRWKINQSINRSIINHMLFNSPKLQWTVMLFMVGRLDRPSGCSPWQRDRRMSPALGSTMKLLQEKSQWIKKFITELFLFWKKNHFNSQHAPSMRISPPFSSRVRLKSRTLSSQ